jgi:hypothetical protein
MKDLLIACACLALAVGCKKKTEDATNTAPKAGESKAGEPKAEPKAGEPKAAPPAAAAAGCAAGATTDAEGGYCIKMPADWKVVETTKQGAGERKGYGIDKFDIRVTISTHPAGDVTLADLIQSKKALATAEAGEKAIGSGDLPGGGYFYAKSFGNGISQGESVVKGAKGPIECSINQKDEVFAEALEACKSLSSL